MIPSSPVTSPGTLFAVGASGTIVEIGEVDPNDRYAFGPFKCIECGSEMVPHKGKVRAHHFKHFGPRTPACTDETYLHFLAKTQLYETIRDAMAAGRPYPSGQMVLDLLEAIRTRRPVEWCDHCGHPFFPQRPEAKYCSTSCKGQAATYRQREAAKGAEK